MCTERNQTLLFQHCTLQFRDFCSARQQPLVFFLCLPHQLFNMAETVYTSAEVAEHSSAASCWFVINNVVYDVTKFLNEHPGGEEVLLEQAGRFATDAFEDVGHSTDARDMLVTYRIGVVAEADREADRSSEPVKTTPTAPEGGGGSSMMTILLPVAVVLIGVLVYRFLSQ